MLISGIICDGPRCKKGLGDKRMEVFWDAAAVNKGRAAPPEEYFRFLNRQRTWDETCTNITDQPPLYNFCSNDCERDFARDEKPVVTPRERIAQEENNKKVEEDRKEELTKRAAKKEPVKASLIPVSEWKDKVVDAEEEGSSLSELEPIINRSDVEEKGIMKVEPLPVSPGFQSQQLNWPADAHE